MSTWSGTKVGLTVSDALAYRAKIAQGRRRGVITSRRSSQNLIENASNVLPMALLRDCLSLSDDPAQLRQLRLTLLSQPTAWEGLCEAAVGTRLEPAARARLIDRGLMPPSPASPNGNMKSPAEVFGDFEQRHIALRRSEESMLHEIVATLNAAGIEPLLIKGARVLWLNTLPWRTMRDLDLIIPRGQEAEAMRVLANIGLLPWTEARDSPGHHHLPPLHRPGLGFLVELHRKAANRYAEPFFTTPEIWQRSVLVERDGMIAHMLPEPEEIWHNLIHNHVGHSGFARGLIDIKGLYEFTVAYSELDAAERENVAKLARRDPVGLAALDLWLAAAQDGLGLTLQTDDTVFEDAAIVWQGVRARIDGTASKSGKYPGYRETLKLALSTDRISRVAAHTGRRPTVIRVSAIRAVLPRIKRAD